MLDRIRSLELHRRARGKVKIYPTINVNTEEEIRLVSFPGSAAPAQAILEDPERIYEYTGKGNRLAVLTDGSAIYGMGNIGPTAGMPIIEGKCLLFKLFGDINAIPICLDCKDPDDLIHTARMLAPTFGGINVEDISSPNTFTALRALQTSLDIPVFCDDQDGTAVVVFAALQNALEVVGKKLDTSRIVICGAGAGGIATAQLLRAAGAKEIVLLNSSGTLCPDNPHMNQIQEEIMRQIGATGRCRSLAEAVKGADVLVGLSVGNLFTAEMIRSMSAKAIVFSLALPIPEISQEEALGAGAAIVGTGLLDPNSFNKLSNIHAFPGILRGALDVRATTIGLEILLAAASALSRVVDRRRLSPQYIIPDIFCDETTPRVAEAVAQKAVSLGIAANPLGPGQVYDQTWQRLFGHLTARI